MKAVARPDAQRLAQPSAVSASTQPALAARQPIYTRRLSVHAYEILYRGLDGNHPDDTTATRSILADGLLWLGLDALADGKPAFVNFGRELLLGNEILGLPASRVVVEVLESVTPDPDVFEALHELRRRGFKLALDDFVWGQGQDALLPHVDIVKLDFGALDPSVRRSEVDRIRDLGARAPRILAEKVETEADFDQAQQLRVDFLQGYLWGLPQLIKRVHLSPAVATSLQLVRRLSDDACSTTEIIAEVKRDPALVQGLLGYANSGMFRWLRPIDSIKQAVLMLGPRELLRWAAMMAAHQASREDVPGDLVTMAVARGRFCELIAIELDATDGALDYFLVGLFSLADLLLGLPLQRAVDELPLSEPLRHAILDGRSEPGLVLRAARAVEQGEISTVLSSAHELGIAPEALCATHLQAAGWASAMR